MRLNSKEKGITIIALVITIIVLLILAGIAISQLLGNGIFEKATMSAEKYAEKSAMEKLQIELEDLMIEKYTNNDYNSDVYLTSKLEEKGFIVNDNIIIVDKYQFQIDRNNLKILASLGKGEEIKQIEIATNVEYATDYTSANLKIEITYERNITQIKINGQETEIPAKINGKYEIEKEILVNENYSIYIKDENDGYKLTNVNVTEISEDITISTVEELAAYRDRVNIGASYEGKTITLSQDINLNENKYIVNQDGSITFLPNAEQWIPIGTIENPFKGTFDGQGHTIKGIYINDETKDTQGFIGQNTGGTVKNLILDEGCIIAGYRLGGVTGRTNYGTIDNVINKMNIESKCGNEINNSLIGGISGGAADGVIKNCTNYGNITAVGLQVGGICGYVENFTEDISNCANLSDYVKTTGASATGYSYIGEIIGNSHNVNITQSYNTVDITAAKASAGGIVGTSTGTITQCYNTGNIQSLETNDGGNNTTGGIAGYGGNTISDCYNTGSVTGTKKIVGGIVGSNAKTDVQVKQELTNCYNIGLVGSATVIYRGGVVGSGKSTSNCYYLTGQAIYGIGASTATTGSDTNADPKKNVELQVLAATLGTNWIDDGKIKNKNGEWIDNLDDKGNKIYINGGYPVLKWQVE